MRDLMTWQKFMPAGILAGAIGLEPTTSTMSR